MEKTSNGEALWIAGVEPPGEIRNRNIISIYEKECREQPERLAELFRAYAGETPVQEEMNQLGPSAQSPGPILFVGMGASYCSAVSGSVFLQTCGRSSFVADAGEWLHYAPEVWAQVAASILVTTSGESAELVRLCQRSTPNPVALICNNEKSKCWSAAKIRLPVLAGPEYANATKTYTNAAAACILLAAHMMGRDWQKSAGQLMAVYSDNLARVFGMRGELERFCRGAENIEIVGRGPAYGGAIMGALCIREMTGKRAAAHTGAGFRHGPLLDVNESHVAIILALGRAAELGVKLTQACNARGGKVILVGTEDQQPSEKLLPVKICAVPEPWEGITSVIVPQALTLGKIEQTGANLRPRFQYGVMEE